MTRFIPHALLLLMLVGLADAPALRGVELDGVLPRECHVGYLLRAPVPATGAVSRLPPPILRPSPSGRPSMLSNGRMIVLAIHTNDAPASFTLPEEWRNATDFCWLSNGVLAILCGARLGVMNQGEFLHILPLPCAGMQLAPAAHGCCYLYGGLGKQEYVYRADAEGGLTNLFRAPAAVTAVAGDGQTTLIGVGRVIYQCAPAMAPAAVLVAAEAVRSIALVPPASLFYATQNRVGYLAGPEKGFTFLKEGATQIFCDGPDLFLHMTGGDVLQIGPVTGFAGLADRLQASRPIPVAPASVPEKEL